MSQQDNTTNKTQQQKLEELLTDFGIGFISHDTGKGYKQVLVSQSRSEFVSGSADAKAEFEFTTAGEFIQVVLWG